MQPIDSAQASALVTIAVKRIATLATQKAGAFIRDRDNRCYVEYIYKKYAAVNAVRNFIYDKQSARLMDIYVHSRFIGARGVHTDDDLIQLLHEHPGKKTRVSGAYVVTGAAGSGKSLLMKYAFLSAQKYAHVPILLELRTFNRVKLGDIETRIQDEFAHHDVNITIDQIKFGLRTGLFTLLLDGFDELKGIVTDYYGKEIERIAQSYPACPILVSSRRMVEFQSWELFDIREIDDMDLSQIEELISKVDFEHDVKNSFLKEVRSELLRTHHDLVKNPLLCTVMLITFSDAGRISRDRPEFFEDAFNALWSKHDARKSGAFERIRATRLKKAEFLRLTGGFAASSYHDADYEMREPTLSRHFDQARRLTAIECDEEDYIFDLTTSTSLAYKEGEIFAFRHRSFQEYFTALFLGSVPDEKAFNVIEQFSDRWQTDSVLSLLLATNERLTERNWVTPILTEISDAIRNCSSVNSYAEMVSSSDVVGEYMKKIRALYNFIPNSDYLTATHHAAIDMSLGVDRNPQMIDLFNKDRGNFLNLRDRLQNKYATGRSALDALLS